jgi:arginase family enzyme
MTTHERRFVILPHVLVREHADQVYIGNEVAGVHLECSAGVKGALALLKTPVTIEALARQSGLTSAAAREILAPLINAVIVVPEDAADALAFGPTMPPPQAIGRFLPIDRIAEDAIRGAFAIIGAPADVGAGMEGLPSHGPLLVRHAFPNFLPPPLSEGESADRQKWGLDQRGVGLVQDLEFRRQYRPEDLPRVLDVGDVPYEVGEGLDRYGARLDFVTDRVLEAGMRPFTIGGDHSVTRFTVGALLRHCPKFGIIHFDAHHDLYKGLPPRPLSHANPFAYLIQEKALAVMLQVGLRAGFEHIDARARPVREPKLRYVSALECQSLTPEQVFEGLPRDLPYYLSFDIDVMDPVYAPETGSPELGGLTYYQCLKLIDHAARHFDLIGADVVEVAGSERRVNFAAKIAGRMLAQILLERTPASPLETYLFERS